MASAGPLCRLSEDATDDDASLTVSPLSPGSTNCGATTGAPADDAPSIADGATSSGTLASSTTSLAMASAGPLRAFLEDVADTTESAASFSTSASSADLRRSTEIRDSTEDMRSVPLSAGGASWGMI